MKLFKNKYFILGNIALVLAVIPVTLFFISRQQDVRSRAAPTTKITFTPQTVSFQDNQCAEQVVTAMIDPGENIVSTVELFLTYDATKFEIAIEPNNTAFPQILRGPTISNGQASVTLNIGSNVSNAIQSPTELAKITIIPVSETTTPASLQVDSTKTRVLSLADTDQATENVFLSGTQVAVSVDAACATGGEPSPSATPSTTLTPSPSLSPSPTPIGGNTTPTPTGPIAPTAPISPTQAANTSPLCTTLSSSPSASGSAPLVITLSAQGSDSDGTIAKAIFDFGDGTVQEVTDGLNTPTATTELSHTYQTPGSYTAAVAFTDNGGATSSTCSKQITVNQSTATPTPVSSGIVPTATATPTPAIENPGSLGTTVAIVGGLILVILGGFALIAL